MMRQGFVAALTVVVLGAGCVSVTNVDTSSNQPPAGPMAFGEPVEFTHVSQTIHWKDGLVVTLKEVRDSRCPEDVVCVWAGELNADYVLSGGELDAETTVTLGTTTKPTETVDSYVLSVTEGRMRPVLTITLADDDATQIPPGIPYGDGSGEVFCTMDAKQCPDGSYVGRVGPNCEFAPCPGN